MRANDIAGIPAGNQCCKRKSGKRPDNVINHLERDFTVTVSNAKWVTDITYIRVGESWCIWP